MSTQPLESFSGEPRRRVPRSNRIDLAGSRFARVVAALLCPAALALTTGSILYAVEAGLDLALAAFLSVTGTQILVAVAERWFPYRATWLKSHDDVRVDAAYFVLMASVVAVTQPVVIAGSIALGGELSARVAEPLWIDSLPLLVQLAAALVVAEFPKYWLHRFSHEWPWLWRFHATHHSSPRLYWLNGERFHPVDILLDTAAGIGTLALLGAAEPVIALYGVFQAVHGVFQHSNLSLRFGPLNWILSSAELHRWHHSAVLDEASSNYGNNLILWDLVFGSYYQPGPRRQVGAVGLSDLPHFPQTFCKQLMSPLRWNSIQSLATEPDAARPSRSL